MIERIIIAFNKPYCQMRAVDSLIVAGIVAGIVLSIYMIGYILIRKIFGDF